MMQICQKCILQINHSTNIYKTTYIKNFAREDQSRKQYYIVHITP